MTINETQDEIIEEFEGLTDWMDRYAYIIDLGNTLPDFPENEKTPQNLIEGCQSRVWITAKRQDDGKIHFEADSDALIVKGIVALLMRVLDDRTKYLKPTFISLTKSDSRNTSPPPAATGSWPW